MRRLPVGIFALIGLFVIGAGASGSSLLALLFPGSALSTLDRKFGDVFGDHQAALASGEHAVLSLSISRRKSRRVNRH